jgi:hypothetical protein
MPPAIGETEKVTLFALEYAKFVALRLLQIRRIHKDQTQQEIIQKTPP